MDDYCNDCGAEDRPLTERLSGMAVCDDCRYAEVMAA